MKIAGFDVVIWAPRIVGVGLAAFLGIFALDSLANPQGIVEAVIAVLMGLVPAIIVLIAVVVGWKYTGIAAAVFALLAVIYALSSLKHTEWIALISGPLVLEAILFFLSWRHFRRD
jgi:hypothetical protein